MSLSDELTAVGIRGRLRARILAEAADHVAEGGDLGDPNELARQFADDLAMSRSRRAAYGSFAALALAGCGYAGVWLVVATSGRDIASGRWGVGVAALLAIATVVLPQVSFVAGGLAVLRARRLHGPAAELALVVARSTVALASAGLALAALALFAVDFGSWLWIPAVALTVPLAAAGALVRDAAAVKSSVPGDAGDVFDDLPVRLPRRPGLLLAGTGSVVAFVMLAAAPNHEGVRNALVEVTALAAGWLALGRRLGLRR